MKAMFGCGMPDTTKELHQRRIFVGTASLKADI
jgi:hypothetical protein